MRLLHVVGRSLIEQGNGIAISVPSLIFAQNKLPDIETKVLFTNKEENVSYDFSFTYYDSFPRNTFEDFLTITYKPDLVIFHEIYYKLYISLYNHFLKLKIPYIIIPRCSLTKAAQRKHYLLKKIANVLFFNNFITSASAVSFLNDGEHSTSIYKKETSIIINNGIEKTDINLTKKSKEEIQIVYLSRIDFYHKGLDYLLHAIRLMDARVFEILLYGDGNAKDIKKLGNELKSINHDFISYKGSVYGNEKKEILEKGHIFILTSRFEGMPMAVLEAISHGMPCILTPGTNMSEDILMNEIGWVTSVDPHTIAATIIKAVDEYRRKDKEYIERCISVAEQKFSWKAVAENSVRQYKKLLLKDGHS